MTPEERVQLLEFIKVAEGHSLFYQTNAANYAYLGTVIRICRGVGRIECKEVNREEFKADIKDAFGIDQAQYQQVADLVAADKSVSDVVNLFA
jgi:hypothetical protein